MKEGLKTARSVLLGYFLFAFGIPLFCGLLGLLVWACGGR